MEFLNLQESWKFLIRSHLIQELNRRYIKTACNYGLLSKQKCQGPGWSPVWINPATETPSILLQWLREEGRYIGADAQMAGTALINSVWVSVCYQNLQHYKKSRET